MTSAIATLPAATNDSVREALLQAAKESALAYKPTCRETFEPYRTQIQACLDKKVSLGKIFSIFQEKQIGLDFSFSAFDRYIRENDYVKQRGKYAAFKGPVSSSASRTDVRGALNEARQRGGRQKPSPGAGDVAAPRVAPDDV